METSSVTPGLVPGGWTEAPVVIWTTLVDPGTGLQFSVTLRGDDLGAVLSQLHDVSREAVEIDGWLPVPNGDGRYALGMEAKRIRELERQAEKEARAAEEAEHATAKGEGALEMPRPLPQPAKSKTKPKMGRASDRLTWVPAEDGEVELMFWWRDRPDSVATWNGKATDFLDMAPFMKEHLTPSALMKQGERYINLKLLEDEGWLTALKLMD